MKVRPYLTETLSWIAVALGLAFFIVSASSCGKSSSSSLVQNVSLSTVTIDTVSYAQFSATLNTGGVSLPSVTLPIINPHQPSDVLGQLRLGNVLSGGGTELAVQIDIERAAHLDTLTTTLPNGTSVPVGGLGSTALIGIPIDHGKAVVYIALSDSVALMGVAVGIKEFDKLGSYVGGVNFFPTFNFGNGVNGLAGIYTGSQSGTSGIALFVNASNLIHHATPAPAPVSAQTLAVARSATVRSVASASAPTSIQFYEQQPRRSAQDRINSELYTMSRKHARLSLVK